MADIRQQFIALSEKKQHSEPKDYGELEGVMFRQLNTLEGEKLGQQYRTAASDGKIEGITSSCLVRLICDENGERVFKDSDAGIINNIAGCITSEMLQDALRYNGLIKTAVKEIKNS